MIGRIHSIVSLSTVDGPGMRYVVFMQGCHLRCKFCHNPDTWDTSAGEELTVDDLVQKIIRAKPYIKNGGVTFSGGEPLLQAEYLLKVCKKLKKENIHIAIDTAGNINIDDSFVSELLDLVDLVLLDIKHIDAAEHKKLVGVDNSKILKFAAYLSQVKQKKMWIRMVYLPGITDNEEALKRTKEFIKKLKTVEKVEILPYHDMGIYKWKELGIPYELGHIKVPSQNNCDEIYHKYFENLD